jgi:hypothetical protein
MSAVFISVTVNLSVFSDLNNHFGREGIHYGSTYTVQTAGYLIDGVAEFTAGVQNRVNNTHGRDFFGRMDVHRDTAAVVGNGNTAVLLKYDVNPVAVACQMFIDIDSAKMQKMVFMPNFHPRINPAISNRTAFINSTSVPILTSIPNELCSAVLITMARPDAAPLVPLAGNTQPIHPNE